MSVTPRELECISSDRLDILEHDHDGHIIRFQAEFSGPFIRAGRAGAPLPQIPDRIDGLMAITPRDTQNAFL